MEPVETCSDLAIHHTFESMVVVLHQCSLASIEAVVAVAAVVVAAAAVADMVLKGFQMIVGLMPYSMVSD